MEWEVIWALGKITMNKASGGNGIPVELFEILKNDAVIQYVSKFGKLSSVHRTGNCQSSFQSPKKDNAAEWSIYNTIALTSHANK